jgi:radical SAM protein with 4Fe4S-binding SPASM domain
MFERIVGELTAYRDTIEGVFIQSYNEPTIEKRFVDIVRTLFNAGLPVAVLTNGSGLTPSKVDAIMKAGMLRYLCINLSTLDREQYIKDRGEDHLGIVLRNLDYLKTRRIADQMRIIVLGQSDETHARDFAAVQERFGDSLFEIEKFHTIDRAGWLEVGLHVEKPKKNLAGCELIGSRPLQHLHITPAGKCVICCHDYEEKYVVGDLSQNSVAEVLEGPEMAKIRRWTYGIEEAPDDFICRSCTFALTR